MSAPVQLRSPTEAVEWLRAHVRGALHTDSRRVGMGDGFIAWPGAAVDGRQFVQQAVAQGAAACLVEAEGAEVWKFQSQGQGEHIEHIACYSHLKAATALIAAEYYGKPSHEIDVLAVTGTNGKTSITWWLAQTLGSCAVIGTLGTGVPPALTYNGLTTPDPVLLQQQLREFAAQGQRYCAIEASSIGIAERRLDGTQIRVALFSNFTHDHLDYHGSMEAYWQAKAELFAWQGLQAAVVNVDDAQGLALTDVIAKNIALWTYGLDTTANPRLLASGVRYAEHAGVYGLVFDVQEVTEEGSEKHCVRTGLIGQYNVSNLLAVLGALRALGHSLAEAVKVCTRVMAVPGRMECIGRTGQPLAVVDYAHTPDALDKALQGLRPLAQARGGQLWCVFGCGGDRDATKRPAMAAIAQRAADQVVVTSDNPRREKPEAIISQILLGFCHGHATDACIHIEADRANAIRHALSVAKPHDVVLIAGKGHESYQEVNGVRHPFSDQTHALAALESWP